MTTELGESHREMRNYHCETVRLRSFHEEIIEQLDVVKRENKNLADEIKDLLEQVSMILFQLTVWSKQLNTITKITLIGLPQTLPLMI